MKNFINFLPPWVETNIQPAFYDKESGTCLQQTARMYAKVNQLVRSVNQQNTTIADFIAQFLGLKDYVEEYFENLDVQEEIDNKLDIMSQDGTLGSLLNNYMKPYIDEQIDGIKDNINNINELLSGLDDLSPKGAYATIAALEAADPPSGVYIVTSDGHIYAWTHGGSATDLGAYQTALNTVTTDILNNLNWVNVNLGENEFRVSPAVESKVIQGNGAVVSSTTRLTTIDYYRFDKVDRISANVGYEVCTGVYAEDGSFLGYFPRTNTNPAWVGETSFADILNQYSTADHFKIMLKRSDNGNILLTEGTNLIVTLEKLKNSVYYGTSLVQDYVTESNWTNGIFTASGTYASNSARMITNLYTDLKYFDTITADNGVEFGIYVWDEDYNHLGYLKDTQGGVKTSPTYWTSLDISELPKNYHYKLYARNTDLTDINPVVAYEDIKMNFKEDSTLLTYIQAEDSGITITNSANASNPIWTEYDGRLAFGMNTSTAQVPTINNQQLVNYGTLITMKKSGQNRWGLHALECYDNTNYNRITMLTDKHMEYGRKEADLYYYTGASHKNSAYGFFKLGSDVRNHSFDFSRDEMIADGVINAHSVIQLANINQTTDLIRTYDTYEEADTAYEADQAATTVNNAKCCKYIQLKDAENGAMWYDSVRHKVVVKVNGVWCDLQTTPVPEGTYDF